MRSRHKNFDSAPTEEAQLKSSGARVHPKPRHENKITIAAREQSFCGLRAGRLRSRGSARACLPNGSMEPTMTVIEQW